MKTIIFCIFFSVVALSEGHSKVSYKGYQVIRANPRFGGERAFLRYLGDHHDLKFWRSPERNIGPVDILVSGSKLALVRKHLLEKRISHSVMIDDVEAAILTQVAPRELQLSLSDFDYNKYHKFEEIQQWIKNFAAAHSNHVMMIEIGTSYENRTFHGVKISTGSGSNKPVFAIDCGIHADEWISPATCIHVIKYLTDAIGTGSKIDDIVKIVDFYIIPSSNPDGYSYTWTNDRMWRKTRSPTSSKCFGVDPNRNWDSNFGGAGSSNDPCSDDYHGPKAWSEANVRAQRDFVDGLKNLQAYIDIHSYSQLWMFPYGYTFNKPRDFELLSRIANESVARIKSVHNTTYTPGQISKVIYVASGSTADYFYDHLKIKCVFAAELRDTGKHGMLLPESEIQPTAEETFAGLMVIAGNIKDGKCAQNGF